ncbi:hypothetical protein ACB098_11G167400 [Castanea mollissima]|uniref:Uncharacterized protein n=1 Tax=Castanea mollissima TaxID=60419 RepID=A0A8J4V9T9_9ROSI|nr:hypothetical protein CMV_024281 [Castanea mollissima]
MSLVDYASSSDDDVSAEEEEEEEHQQKEHEEEDEPQQLPNPNPHNQISGSSSNLQPESTVHSSEPSIERLPDASFLLNSPASLSNLMSSSDHSSRVAAAMAENASRKRDSNGLASSLPRNKVPRGTLPHSRNVPDTVGGVLVPPQLSGRSNVVTEDIGKLFVRKHAEPSSN